MSIACSIIKYSDKFNIEIYNVETKQSNYFELDNKIFQEIIRMLITMFGNDIGIIVIKNSLYSKPYEQQDFKEEGFKEYGSLVHLPTEEELDFEYYLTSKVEYSVGELIIQFEDRRIILYRCIKVIEGKVTWNILDIRDYCFNEQINFEYVEKIFDLKMSQVHAAFEHTREMFNSVHNFELGKYGFKSVNFIHSAHQDASILARHLISDSNIPVLVNIAKSNGMNHLETYAIEDLSFIHIPKLVKDYSPKTDIMGIDLGSTRSVLAVSRNRQIHVIPFDNSSPGDLWTESVVSFDEGKPLFGNAALRRLRTKPEYVIFDIKLVCNKIHRENILKQSIWPFKFNVDKKGQPYLETMTCQGLQDFSLPKINAIFLEKMAKAASEYQDEFNNGNAVKKAVITVPRYFFNSNWRTYQNSLITSVIEAAELAGIEIIDIIEETHADLLYYMSNEKYSKIIKPGMKIAIFDIGGGTCILKVYKISEHERKTYANCTMELQSNDDAKCSGRAFDNIIIEEIEKLIPEDIRNNVKLRTAEAAKKIKHELSFEEKTEFDLSDIHPSLEGITEFTRKWFEEKLKIVFDDQNFYYWVSKSYSLPSQNKQRCEEEKEFGIEHRPLDDVDIIFLAGGTCRMPFIQKWIKEQSTNAKIEIDGQLEIVTATGAAIHALQVLNGEIQPYIKFIKRKIVCGITRRFTEIDVEIYCVKAKKKLDYSYFKHKPIHEIIDELITMYGNDIGIIVITNDCYSEPGKLEDFKEDDFKKYGSLVHLSTKEELKFKRYLTSKVEYSVGELIIQFEDRWTILYQCIAVTEGKVIWKELDMRDQLFNKCVDFEYIERMFNLKMNQVHVVFDDVSENINSMYGSKFDKYDFKSINFLTWKDEMDIPLMHARHLISDPEVPILLRIEYCKSNFETHIIEDLGFIHIPKLVTEYEPRTDIMGIDLGSTRSVLAVSRNKEIQIVNIDDNSSEKQKWIQSVVSFDEEKPIIGKAAVEKLENKSNYIIFDHKLLYNMDHRENILKQSIWPFKFNVDKKGQPYLETMTCQGLQDFSLPKINAIFLEKMAKAASEYQDEFNNGNAVKKAVITVPRYFQRGRDIFSLKYKCQNPFISNAIEAAKLVNIEVADVIEETHADLLYYLTKEEYSKMIRSEMKIIIFDIGGGTCICRVYEISENEGKMYATCISESYSDDDAKCSGRAFDNIIIEEIEKLIPEDIRNNVKLRTAEAAKKIKHELSFEEKTEFDLSNIHPNLEGITEFTRKWFERKLESFFKKKKCYYNFKKYLLPTEKKDRCKQEEAKDEYPPLNNVDLVFLIGGTCRIPFVQKWIRQQFPNSKVIRDEELEIITATGAAIHALQVLSGEVKPYIKLIEHQISESHLNNEKSEKKLNEQSKSLKDIFHLEKEPRDIECHHEKESYNTVSDEKKDNFNRDFSCSGAVVNRDQINIVHQLEIKVQEIEIEIHKINSKSYLENKSNTQISEEKDDNFSNCLSLNQGAAAKHNQAIM